MRAENTSSMLRVCAPHVHACRTWKAALALQLEPHVFLPHVGGEQGDKAEAHAARHHLAHLQLSAHAGVGRI